MSTTKRVFIFAHCDDEVFCLPLLLDEESENTVIFLTTLNRSLAKAPRCDTRRQEALKANKALNKLVKIEILFFDSEIYDGSIHTDFCKKNFKELTRIVLDRQPDELVTLAYEGGHQDHDSTYLITRLISENNQLGLRCFSGYRASNLLPRFFSVLRPISTNGKITYRRTLVVLTSIRLMAIYKSQAKSWLGLALPLLLKYVFFPFWESKCESALEPQPVRRIFYENRGRAKQSEVLNSHRRFIEHFRSRP